MPNEIDNIRAKRDYYRNLIIETKPELAKAKAIHDKYHNTYKTAVQKYQTLDLKLAQLDGRLQICKPKVPRTPYKTRGYNEGYVKKDKRVNPNPKPVSQTEILNTMSNLSIAEKEALMTKLKKMVAESEK